ncbi:MAG: sensor histidine kinase, partial [Ferruginibacter sp.]|nr:sensor histidine kinase [Ferruginibacter sp.]
ISNNILQLSDKSKYILYNLISNGIKFKGSAPPIITIYSKMERDTVVLIIEDNGIGIPKKGLGKIFDMYGRLHRDVEGNGIGLYLAKKIIDAANGNIVVESEPRKGTRFIVYLKQGG